MWKVLLFGFYLKKSCYYNHLLPYDLLNILELIFFFELYQFLDLARFLYILNAGSLNELKWDLQLILG